MIGIVLTSCAKDEDQYKEINLTMKSKQIVEADNAFGLELFQRIVQGEEKENLMLSPLSISTALSMAYNGAESTTMDEMAAALKVEDFTREELNETYKQLLAALIGADSKVALDIANSIWYSKTYPVEDSFLDVNRSHYNAEVRAADFADPETLKAINDWVNNQTKGKIEKIIDEIPPEMVMYLINAIYFKGSWTREFNSENTSKLSFRPAEGDAVMTDMMNREDTLLYYANDDFSSIELPYGSGNFNMTLLLPNEDKTVSDITNQLTADNWKDWKASMVMTNNIDILLPKFKIEYDITLNDVLQAMGMQEAFTSQADFSSINPARNLFISFVKHKSFIEVNEEGTEAAAVTVIGFELTSMDPDAAKKIYFHCTKPFLFAITEKETGAILFIGRVGNPEA